MIIFGGNEANDTAEDDQVAGNDHLRVSKRIKEDTMQTCPKMIIFSFLIIFDVG
jgi:hypothetical protein